MKAPKVIHPVKLPIVGGKVVAVRLTPALITLLAPPK